jgi:hypothetical protein
MAVTLYMHVFVYHLGYYLEQYSSIELLANYATEGRYKYNKQVLVSATNGWSFQNKHDNNITKQLFSYSYRDDKIITEKLNTTNRESIILQQHICFGVKISIPNLLICFTSPSINLSITLPSPT